MRLGIISDCVHVQHPDGRIGTETHIFLKQIEALANYFETVVLVCPFTEYSEKKVVSYYSIPHLSTITVPNVGGNNFAAKIKLLQAFPSWIQSFRAINKSTDIVYQRFPNNLNIPGFFFFYLNRKKVFATYTGTWKKYRNEPLTYRFQKFLLKHFFRGPIWAYLETEDSKNRIIKTFSPSYSQSVWDEELDNVANRISKYANDSTIDLLMISVGAFNKNKNQQLILNVCLLLRQAQIPFHLTLVGDGILRTEYETFISKNDLQNNVVIAGKKTAEELRELYRKNNIVVQCPLIEGFGKVPIEGFFHGLIPIVTNVGISKSIIQNGKAGLLIEPNNSFDLLNKLQQIHYKKIDFSAMILAGRDVAKQQTLEFWAHSYYQAVIEYLKK